MNAGPTRADLPSSHTPPSWPFRLQPPDVSSSPLSHATPQRHESLSHRGGFVFTWQTRRSRLAESSSSSYGLATHLQLLPTPPRGDAVTLGYGPESVCPGRTCTFQSVCA